MVVLKPGPRPDAVTNSGWANRGIVEMIAPCWIVAAALTLVLASLAAAQQYTISTYAGSAPLSIPATGTAASIGAPLGIATDAAGNIYFSSGHCVFKLDTKDILTRVAGTCRAGYSGDGGQATNAQLRFPDGIAVGSMGNLYIADAGNNRIRLVSPDGTISTVAGNGGVGYSADGGQAKSTPLFQPSGVAVDGTGNLYIADSSDN